jgi:methionyl aminopeptidase
VVTKDRSLSAQWEHMVAVTADGFEVLTPWPDESADYPPPAPLAAIAPSRTSA